MFGNNIKNQGNNNFFAQDITNSTINYYGISDQIKGFIDDLRNWYNEHINKPITLKILVISTNSEKIKGCKEIDANNVFELYGNNPSDWRPFTTDNNSIIKLLNEFQEKSYFRIKVYFIDNVNIEDREFKRSLKLEIRKASVLIVDGFSLLFDTNKQFAELFDEDTIGGLLYPICEKHSKDVKDMLIKIRNEVFDNLTDYTNNVFNKQFGFIELEVPNKNSLFRRLANIAILNLRLKEPAPQGEWLKNYENNAIENLQPNFR
jgi:hypothetical protein